MKNSLRGVLQITLPLEEIAPRIKTAGDCAMVLKDMVLKADEHSVLVVTDKDGYVLRVSVLGAGTPYSVWTDTRDMRAAMAGMEGRRVWHAHNHPSYVSFPSQDDRDFVKWMKKTTKEMRAEYAGTIIVSLDGATHVDTMRQWPVDWGKVPFSARDMKENRINGAKIAEERLASAKSALERAQWMIDKVNDTPKRQRIKARQEATVRRMEKERLMYDRLWEQVDRMIKKRPAKEMLEERYRK